MVYNADKGNHDVLLLKSSKFGLPFRLIERVKSHLSKRTHKVLFNSALANSFDVTSGVPQGSHLEPFFFLIYINDLPNAIQNSQILI